MSSAGGTFPAASPRCTPPGAPDHAVAARLRPKTVADGETRPRSISSTPVARMIRELRNGLRLFALVRILARHDALFVFDRIDAARLLVLVLLRPFVRRQPGRLGEKL